MTREEIEEFSGVELNRFETDREEDWYKIGCIDGLEAADAEPNLASLWHDAYKEPEIGSNIIVVDKYGQWREIQPYDGEYDGYGSLTGWECCVAQYNNIQRWAYIDDLLPKQFRKSEQPKGGEK